MFLKCNKKYIYIKNSIYHSYRSSIKTISYPLESLARENNINETIFKLEDENPRSKKILYHSLWLLITSTSLNLVRTPPYRPPSYIGDS
ncbi:hypothetical protein BpHYR1_010678, partial [Brachionus plicatilis]